MTLMPTLILLRHGQSEWNKENRFTGWVDIDVSEEGVSQAREAGRIIRERKLGRRCSSGADAGHVAAASDKQGCVMCASAEQQAQEHVQRRLEYRVSVFILSAPSALPCLFLSV